MGALAIPKCGRFNKAGFIGARQIRKMLRYHCFLARKIPTIIKMTPSTR